MKHGLIFLVMLLIGGCNIFDKQETKEFKQSPRDTLITTVQIVENVYMNKYPTITLWKVRFDTVGYVTIDKQTQKIKEIRDSAYWFYTIDTARNANRTPLYDTGSKRYVMRQIWDTIPKQFILHDFNRNWPKPK